METIFSLHFHTFVWETSNVNFWYTTHETGHTQGQIENNSDISCLRGGLSLLIDFSYRYSIFSLYIPSASCDNEDQSDIYQGSNSSNSLAYYFKMWHSQLPIGYSGYMHDLASVYLAWSRASTNSYSTCVFSTFF